MRLIRASFVAIAFASCSPQQCGDIYNKVAAQFRPMPERGATAFKPGKPEQNEKAAERLKGAQFAPVENYGHTFTFESGDKLYIDKKRGMAKVVGPEPGNEVVAEGKFRRITGKKVFIIIDTDKDYEVGFSRRGSIEFYPKLKKD